MFLRRTWFTTTELATSLLVLLPYVILQATNNVHSASQSLENILEGMKGRNMTSLPRHATHGLLSACALTSGTLMIVGVTSKAHLVMWRQDASKSGAAGHKRTASFTSMQVGSISVQRGRQVLSRLLGVGLPFYATTHLGSERVGLVMLAALVGDIAATDNEPRDLLTRSSAKRLLSLRRWTLVAMLLQLSCDILGLTNTSTLSEKLLGYLALSISIFVSPPPYPTMTAKKAYISSPDEPPPSSGSTVLATLKEAPATTQAITASESKVSPLVYTPEDVDLTLITGAVLGLLTFLTSFFMIPTTSDFSEFSLIGIVSAIGAAALALTIARPQSLRESRGIGLALASLLSSSFSMLFGPASWMSFTYQAFLITLSFAAVSYDTHKAVSVASHNTHGHSHGHVHHHEEKKHSDHHVHPSRISRYLLDRSQGWPLLHSILVEKDSRRIFFFMMWVPFANIIEMLD